MKLRYHPRLLEMLGKDGPPFIVVSRNRNLTVGGVEVIQGHPFVVARELTYTEAVELLGVDGVVEPSVLAMYPYIYELTTD